MEKLVIEFLVSNWQWVLGGIFGSLGLVGSAITFFWLRSLKHAEWKGRTDASVNTINESLTQIKDSLTQLRDLLLIGKKFYETESPIKLTKHGNDVVNSTSMREWIKDYVRELSVRTKDKEEFEIYEECEKFIEKNMKDSTFSHNVSRGAYHTGVNKTIFKKILSIVLRDEVLKSLGKL